MGNMKKEKLTFIDLFAGCGGLSEGFLQSGNFEALAHVEWKMPMVETLRNRLEKKWKHSNEDAHKRVIQFDIQKTDELVNGKWSEESIKKYGKNNHKLILEKGIKGLVGKQKVDLIIGGPPCQAYSIAGRAQDKNSMKDDYRKYLFESFVKVVDVFQPVVFVFENVAGMLSACMGGKMVTERVYEAFNNINYEIRTPINLKKSVNTASELGVPQKRNRIIIIGVRKKSKINLEDFYQEIDVLKKRIKPKSVRDAIGKLPALVSLKKPIKIGNKNTSHILQGNVEVKFHEPRYHNTNDIMVFKKWLKDEMNKARSKEKIAFYNLLKGKQSNHAKYRNIEWGKPSPTIVAHLYKDGLMIIHPDILQARSITAKEAALLQSFAYDFIFMISKTKQYKKAGNALPALMAA
jgi:DNA (cytosine-5)-methyltransferase 1